MACAICHNFQPPTLDDAASGRRAVYFINVRDLLDRAKTRECTECVLLYDCIRVFKQEWRASDESRSIELRVAKDQPLEIFYRTEPLYLELFRDGAESHDVTAPNTIGVTRTVSSDSQGSESRHLLREWLTECQTHHQQCRPSRYETRLPTRILEIDQAGDKVFLLQTFGIMGEYVALSYCWGLPQANAVLKTDHATLEQHLKGITVDKLPKTIREAISVTHGFGFKHIWVDALCILQDDPDDWAHEAGQMGKVYSNAALTIVASRAAGTADGLLGEQTFHKSHVLSYKGGHVRVREALARQHADFMTLDREPFNNEPINKRAWTLQEAVLSNRAIFFTTSELTWQCNTWRRCECDFGSKQISSDDIGDYRSLRTDVFMGSRTQEDAYTMWDDLVTLLSKRSITYESDRLPALAGLAQQFHERMATAFNTHDQYLAGIWRGRLPQALLCMADGETVREVSDANLHFYKPTIWRAPSWSWCSMEAPVTFPPYIDLEPLLEIVSVSIVPRGPDQYGQLESAEMTVRGRYLTDLVARPTSQNRIGSRLWVLCHGDFLLGTFTRDVDDRDREEDHCSAVVVGRITLLATYYTLVLRSISGKTVYERVGVAHLGPYFSSDTMTEVVLG